MQTAVAGYHLSERILLFVFIIKHIKQTGINMIKGCDSFKYNEIESKNSGQVI